MRIGVISFSFIRGALFRKRLSLLLVPRPMSFAMFEAIRIADRFVAHPRHSPSYGCGSLRGLVARTRLSACTQNLWGEVQASSPASCDQRPTSAGNSSRDLIKASGRG